MLTYPINRESKICLCEQLYSYIKQDIISGALRDGEKLPSKRALAEHLNISVVTVRAAYEQLIAEGFILAVERRGYFACAVDSIPPLRSVPIHSTQQNPKPYKLDLIANSIPPESFPFTIWSRTMRKVLLDYEDELLAPIPANGAFILRKAIADHLLSFRGMLVNPDNIVVAAGTETLYGLLLPLFGIDSSYAVEDPGYPKISRIFNSFNANVSYIPLDDSGIRVDLLDNSAADIVHVSPAHHFPTGAVMPIRRRAELLRWAEAKPSRFILEDEYDSEFRFTGKPIPPIFSVDETDSVVFINTFSKSLAPSIRIGYMVLPDSLMHVFRSKLGFYSCTVSAFEQYTLAEFISNGHFERHINRVRTLYRKKRDAVISLLNNGNLAAKASILEQNSGLHFLVKLNTALDDETLTATASQHGIRLAPLSAYSSLNSFTDASHTFIVNYSGANLSDIAWGFDTIASFI